MNAAAATQSLDGFMNPSSSPTTKVTSAFDVLGVPAPKGAKAPPDQGERFIQAITGERKSIPGWNGQPGTLRSWLKLLAYWETETTLSRDKWGLRLYQSFPEGSQPRKIADQIPMGELLKESGYDKVLTVLMQKYRPYLEVAGPAAVDKYFYTGERGKGETFANYIANKEVLRQDLESHLNEALNDKVAGRILLRHANLSEFQREMVSLRDQASLMGFDQVAAMLRPLDRPELLAQAAGAELGQGASKHFPTATLNEMPASNSYYLEEGVTDGEHEEVYEELGEEEESEEMGEDELFLEDRKYDEDEAIYVQAYHSAYADVRKDLRDRRRERGFVKHNKATPSRSSSAKGKGRGRSRRPSGKGYSSKASGRGSAKVFRGTSEDLQSRTRCYNCDQLGHYARDCPLKGGGKGGQIAKKVNFVISRGSPTSSSAWMTSRSLWPRITQTQPPDANGVLRSISIFAGVRVQNYQALVDTAAEDAVIGEGALAGLKEALKEFGLQTVSIPVQGQAPCAGIGGEAKLIALEDVPVSVAGVHGLLRFNVLQDNAFSTPPLLPISFLDAIGAVIDLPNDQLRTFDGHSASMVKLPSGHRAINILAFGPEPWRLPQQHLVQGQDPFQLCQSQELASSASSRTSTTFATTPATPTIDLCQLNADNPQVHIFVQQGEDGPGYPENLRYITTLRGWRTQLVPPSEIAQLCPEQLDGHRSTLAVDPHGHVQRVLDVWNGAHSHRALDRRWQGVVTFFLRPSSRTTFLGSGAVEADGADGDDPDDPKAPASSGSFDGGGNGDRGYGGSSRGQSSQQETTGHLSSYTKESASRAQWLMLKNPEEVENRARELRRLQRFNSSELEDLLISMKTPKGGRGTRRGTMHSVERGPGSFVLVLGAYVHGSQYGITSNTKKYPEVTQYLTEWFVHHAPNSEFSSISVSSNLKAGMHRDVHNSGASVNITTAVGCFRGGSLWIEQKEKSAVDQRGGESIVARQTLPGVWTQGKLVDTRHRVVQFSPKLWHGVQGWKGNRISVTAYTIRKPHLLSNCDKECLCQYGFPLSNDAPRFSGACIHMSIGEPDEREDTSHQCEYDHEGVFVDSLALQSPSHPVHPAVSMFKRMSTWIGCARRRPRSFLSSSRDHVAPGPRGEAGCAGEGLECFGVPSRSSSSKDGQVQVRGDVEEAGDSLDHDPQHSTSADGGGRLCDHRERPLPRGEDGGSQRQSSGSQTKGGPDRPGNRQATGPFQSAEDFREGARTMQPPPGQDAMSSELHQSMVDLHELRQSVATDEPSGAHGGQDSRILRDGAEDQRQLRTGISTVPAGPEGKASTGGKDGGAGCPRSPTSHWIDSLVFFDASSNDNPGPRGDSKISADDPQTTFRTTSASEVQNSGSWGTSGELRDRQRRRDLERGHYDRRGEVINDTAFKPKILLEPHLLQDSRDPRLFKLTSWLKGRGWALKTLLVLITWINGAVVHHYPECLGIPCLTVLWDEDQQDWYEQPTSESPVNTLGCLVYDQKMRRCNWFLDEPGSDLQQDRASSTTLSKRQKQALKTVAATLSDKDFTRSTTSAKSSDKIDAPVGSLDLGEGWDFSSSEHRQGALSLIQSLSPAIITLRSTSLEERMPRASSSTTFTESLALLQLRQGRGYVWCFGKPPSWKNLQSSSPSLLQRPETVVVGLNEDRIILVTNMDSVAGAWTRKLHRGDQTNSPPRPYLVTDNDYISFSQVFAQGLQRHLQSSCCVLPHIPDHWERGRDFLLCRHFSPRRTFTVPKDCPRLEVAHMQFTGTRITIQQFLAGSTHVYEDNWIKDHPQPTSRPWTGVTKFHVYPTMVLPEPTQHFAQWLVSSAAHDLYEYQNDEINFQVEYRMLFPSHKILGQEEAAHRREMQRSGRATSTSAPLADIPEEDDEIMGLGAEEQDAPEVAMTPIFGEDEKAAARELRELPVPAQDRLDAPTPELRRELFRIHRNLGHPDRQSFCRALKHAGVKPDIIKWVKIHFDCPICSSRKRPVSHRPAHLSRRLDFNEVVGVDLIYYERKPLLNMLCWGTNFQQVALLPDSSARETAKALIQCWFGHYGPPKMLICDQGTEFTGKEFSMLVSDYAVVLHYTDTASPWQNSRTERAGGIFKSRLAKVCLETSVISEEDLQLAIVETTNAHNQYYNRSGYSPYQRVFGTSMRVPASLLSDDVIDRSFLAKPETDEMKRAQEIREAAGKAWMERQDWEAVTRALKSNTRTVDMVPVKNGDRIYIWRSTTQFKGWAGPAMVVQVTENGRTVWASLRGYLLKASREQVRLANHEENLGAELVKVMAQEFFDDLETGRIKHYKDVQEEGPPPEEQVDFDVDTSLYCPSPASPVDEAPGNSQASPEEPDDSTMANTESNPMEEVSTQEPMSEPPTPLESRRASIRSGIRVDEGSGGTFCPIREVRRQPPMPYPMSDQIPSWPSPSQASHYVAALPQEQEEWGKMRWWKDRTRDRWQPIPSSKETFGCQDAVATYNHGDKRMYLTKKKESPGQVEYAKLSSVHKKVFDKSRNKEIQSLIDSGAIEILSVADSLTFEKEHPNHVLTSRYVDRWKPCGESAVLPDGFDSYDPENHLREDVAAKSRWTVVGWKDPEVHAIERAAPTPLTTTIYLMMQLAACRQWPCYIKDIKTAFLQGKPTTRKQKLAVRMPREAFPGLDPRQLVLLLTEIYGLVSGPAWWRRTLLEFLVRELGYRINCYDKCLLTLDAEENGKEDPTKTQGVIVIEVDDILEAGGPRHRKLMQRLESKFKFGKIVDLMKTPEGTGYAGRRLRQLQDYSILYDMQEYVTNRLKFVHLERNTLKKNAATTILNAEEESQLRGVIAAVNWASREGRPDASAAASLLAGCFPGPSVADAWAVNRVIEHLKQHEVILKIHALREEDVRHLVVSDASFDPTGKCKPQHGWLQAITTPLLNRGGRAPISLVSWRSKKMKRKAGNTLLCESVAMSTAIGALEKQEAVWRSLCKSKFDPKERIWDMDEELGLKGEGTVIADENANYRDPAAIAVADAKSLFDALHSEQAHGEDDRAALEIAIIKDSLSRLKGRIRWVPHNVNPADALTKLENAHMLPLMQVLRTSHFQIEAESDVLLRGKQGEYRQKSKA